MFKQNMKIKSWQKVINEVQKNKQSKIEKTNVIKFHEAKFKLVSEKVVHEQKDKKCLRNTNILNYLPCFDNSSILLFVF